MGQNDGECRTAAMAPRIEDYAIIGNTRTAALVNRDGSIDWLCTPRFDSGACFAALLGDRRHGRWLLAPAGEHRVDGRRYRDDTLVLETGFSTDGGAVRVADAMPVRDRRSDVVRLVEGVRGRVRMRGELAPRFDYGQAAPWLRVDGRRACALAGPDTVFADADVPFTVADDDVILSEFEVGEGERVGLRLQWVPPRQSPSAPGDIAEVIAKTTRWWQEWTGRCGYRGRYRTQVIRSLITLKALTYAPSGGMVAAATTSLPERLGGVRNWDYRYCWIRDATFTLLSLLDAGYVDEAAAWREWLVRSVAPARVRRLPPRPHRQQGRRAVPARRVRGADGRRAPGPRMRPAARRERLAGAARAAGLPRRALAGTRQRDMGDARPSPRLHPLQGHGLDGRRPGRPGGRGVRHGRARRGLEAAPAGDLPGSVRARL